MDWRIECICLMIAMGLVLLNSLFLNTFSLVSHIFPCSPKEDSEKLTIQFFLLHLVQNLKEMAFQT